VTIKSAIVYGATGLIGKHLLTKLLLSEHYGKVYAVVRRHISHTHPKLEVIILPGERLHELNLDLTGADAFSALGTTIKQAGSREAFRTVDYDYNLAFAKVCKKMGVAHFLLVSALGASARSLIFYSRVKGELEDAIKQLDFSNLTIAQPSLLLGDRDTPRLGETIASKFSPLLAGPLAAYKAIHGERVAEALVTLAGKPGRDRVTVLTSRDLATV
jgi:uncharacterized protein YbjT (DUF2867 family)